jgi:uncharacterized protein YndB with AHSA1/START domain
MKEGKMATPGNGATAPEDRVLVMTRIFDAPRSLVFKVWTEPQHLVCWWGPRGYTTPVCEMDVRPGGAYRLLMRSAEGQEVWWHGVFREIVEPERLVWTCSIDRTDGTRVSGETVLTVTLEEQGQKTKLTLHQAVFDSIDNCNAHREGWTEAFERIAERLADAA